MKPLIGITPFYRSDKEEICIKEALIKKYMKAEEMQ